VEEKNKSTERAKNEGKRAAVTGQWHLFSHIQEQKTQHEVKPAGFTSLS
jgi:hypothetical protein